MSNISVILPTYNERDNIEKMIEVLEKNLPSVEIIIVDDDSPDKTWQVAEEMCSKYSNLRLIRRRRRGLASAIREGIDIAGSDIIVWLDCDFSMPPAIINNLIIQINSGYDIVVASRYIEQGADAREPKFMVWSSKFINKFAMRLLHSSIRDLTSGFIASKKGVFSRITLRGYYGEYCIDFLLHAERLGLKIKEVPYKCLPRLKGQTKTAPNFITFVMLGIRYFITIFKLRICVKK